MRVLQKIYIIPISIIVLLYGCGEVKDKIGLIKKAPDEFQVYEKKPLSVPPNFDLRAPAAEDKLVDESDESDEKIIFSNIDNKDENLTLSDELLLIAVGEKEIESNIRKIINDQNSIETLDKSFIDQILDFDTPFDAKVNEGAIEINPVEEKERIEKLKKEGNIIKVDNNAIIIEKEGSLD